MCKSTALGWDSCCLFFDPPPPFFFTFPSHQFTNTVFIGEPLARAWSLRHRSRAIVERRAVSLASQVTALELELFFQIVDRFTYRFVIQQNI